MIDQDVFNIEWAVICERYNRDPSQVLAARYYQSLSPRMTTDEFRATARVVFEEQTYFPRPMDFIEAIRPSVEAEALEQWELCERVMDGSKEAFMHMSPTGKRTVQLLGGPDRLRNTKLDQVQFVRRDFLKLFGVAEEIYRREKQRTALPLSDEAKEILASAVPLLSGGREQFNRAWRILCKRLRRDLDAEEAADYRAWLSGRMDTDQFLEAARHLWATCKFFPEPAAFIEAIRPSVEAEALEQWELCGQVMTGSRKAFMHMSPTGKRTVQLLGGPDRLRNTKLDQVPFVRRDFLKLFGVAEEIYRREKQRTALPLSDEAKEILASAVPLLSGGRPMQEASDEGT